MRTRHRTIAVAGFFAFALAPGALHSATESRAVRDAQRCVERGDTLAAIRLLEHSHLKHQPDPGAHLMLGRLWRQQGTIEGRLRSQRVLEEARSRWGSDAPVLMELGRTYNSQGFYSGGLACFDAVLQADATNCDARFMVGLHYYRNWKRVNQFDDDLRTARRNLRAALDCDPDNADAALMFLYAGYALGDTSCAECDRQLARHPDRPEFHFCRGTLDFDAGRYEACERQFERALALSSPAERDAYASLVPVLPVMEWDSYNDAAADARSVMQRGFWVGADPDATTPLNELELEHAYRLFVADVLYSHIAGGQRGWETDRGEVFVKFGRPLTVAYTLGDDNRNGRIETWSYVIGGEFQQFVFVDEFLNGNPRIPYGDDLLSFCRHSPSLSRMIPVVAPLPASVDITAFRDDGLSSSIYVTVSVSADSLRAAVNLSRVDKLITRCACFDPEWNCERTVADTTRTSEVNERTVSRRRVIERTCRLELPFDRYHVAVAMEDGGATSRATARGDGNTARFIDDGLVLSDVLLFDAGTRSEDRRSIDRGGARMRPRVGHRYGPGERVHAYLEAYNLSLSGGISAYDVRIAIYPARDKESPVWADWSRGVAEFVGIARGEPVVAQSFRREGRSHEDHESIAIDVNALRPGRYRLVVEITDLGNNRRASTETQLIRDAPPIASNR